VVELDYVVIGHVTRDLVDKTVMIGGTASYAARTARGMGCRVGVVTSAGPEFDPDRTLAGMAVACLPAETTTTFENVYTAGGRHQVLHGVAAKLTADAVPPEWKPALVHLGPVAQECDPALARAFNDAFLGLTPQGWMRRWDRHGHVSPGRWEDAEGMLVHADAAVVSEEDVAGDDSLISRFASLVRVLVVTRGAAGCTLHTAGRVRPIPAPSTREVDPTGSGDVFAAAFFVRLERGDDPQMAARFANCVAARSVTRKGLAGTPGPDEIARCERALTR
jgi:sugar/nucleoside kinase (ribokinase family)